MKSKKEHWVEMKTSVLMQDQFPMSDQSGESTAGINTRRMRQIAQLASPINQQQLEQKALAHLDFLQAGGAGGQYRTLLVNDIVVAMYEGPEAKEGELACFEYGNLSKLDFSKMQFPFASFCGVYAPKLSFVQSDLSYATFTDADLEGANFQGACLKKVDFSRANLRAANFQDAILSGVDFENCDLTGADFRGTQVDWARFPGAILEEVKV